MRHEENLSQEIKTAFLMNPVNTHHTFEKSRSIMHFKKPGVPFRNVKFLSPELLMSF